MKITLAANWKMNLQQIDIENFINELKHASSVDIILAAAFPYLTLINENDKFHAAAQNVHDAESGAFTGEVSVTMLSDLNINYCIIGHSERRQYFSENDDLIAKKAEILIGHNITPIICIGENLEERQSGETLDIVNRQLSSIFTNIEVQSTFIIAYEPVWAIGTGQTASPEQAQEVHQFIRDFLNKRYNSEKANSTSILYGGSMNESNAKALVEQNDINGGLIGSASLNATSFNAIIDSVKDK